MAYYEGIVTWISKFFKDKNSCIKIVWFDSEDLMIEESQEFNIRVCLFLMKGVKYNLF